MWQVALFAGHCPNVVERHPHGDTWPAQGPAEVTIGDGLMTRSKFFQGVENIFGVFWDTSSQRSLLDFPGD